MRYRLANVFRFAMPFLQTSLIKQIMVGLILGVIMALAWPEGAASVGLLGKIFVTALKGVAPVLVFILVLSAIANQGDKSPVPESGESRNPIKVILALYIFSTFGAAILSVFASFAFPTEITLASQADATSAPGGMGEVLSTLLLNVVDNPVNAIAKGNYIGILAWAIACGLVLRKSRKETRIVLTDATKAVEFVVQLVICFAPVGIFGLVASTIATEGFVVLAGYARLLGVLLGTMVVVALVLNPLLVWLVTRENPFPVTFIVLRESAVSAFFTRSSAANIPVNMAICHRLNLPESTYAVSVPVGSTVNMAGAAVTITVITLSAAYSLGVEVGIGSAIFLSFVASICAAGTSGVPGGSLMLLPLACGLFGIDQDMAMQVVAVGFIISVLQDSTETGLNSSSDVLFTIAGLRAVEKSQGLGADHTMTTPRKKIADRAAQ